MISNDLTRELWEQFLRTGGTELFRQMLSEAASGEQLTVDITVETFDGKPLPEQVALMIVMRVAIKTLAAGVALDRVMAGDHDRQ